jgi:hypothetical protein
MRFFVSVVVLLIASATLFAQKPTGTKCELQELAIDAALGVPDAQYNLGVAFFRGEEVPQDYTRAATMWRLAGNAGVIEAHNNLGFLTYYGKGIKQDYAEGIRLWRLAAEKGFAESQVHLAEAYYDGNYLILDFSEAYAWAKTAKHYATVGKDPLREPIAQMAEDLLKNLRRRLTPSQLEAAEERARSYISKYAPPK